MLVECFELSSSFLELGGLLHCFLIISFVLWAKIHFHFILSPRIVNFHEGIGVFNCSWKSICNINSSEFGQWKVKLGPYWVPLWLLGSVVQSCRQSLTPETL